LACVGGKKRPESPRAPERTHFAASNGKRCRESGRAPKGTPCFATSVEARDGFWLRVMFSDGSINDIAGERRLAEPARP